LGTHERFIGFLLEHYAGKLPLWLAPLQVKLLPISDKYMDYTTEVHAQLRKAGIRAEIDSRAEKVGRKIRDAELSRVPYMFIVGEKEQNDKTVSVRVQGQGEEGEGDLGAVLVSEIIADMVGKIAERSAS